MKKKNKTCRCSCCVLIDCEVWKTSKVDETVTLRIQTFSERKRYGKEYDAAWSVQI